MVQALLKMKERHLRGEIGGALSVCSSHPVVLRTALRLAREEDLVLLVEATANQVNQFGGYSGMDPAAFASHLAGLARESGFAKEQLLIGADHLGPHVWKNEPAGRALDKCADLVRQCIGAGFHKIHLDTAVRCADDPGPDLPLGLIAERAARLCRAAEECWRQSPRGEPPVYVIGNEVPAPGGALEQESELAVTQPEDLKAALEAYRAAFTRAGAACAWDRVVAVVVQPGVDFGDRRVAPYRPRRAAALSAAHGRLPDRMSFEIHAADYQLPAALRQMVSDHFILLKVGPCLTFALREALYALADIEAALPQAAPPSRLKEVMERLMQAQPEHWRATYGGPPEDLFFLRHYSLRDRIRYYWSCTEAQSAVQRLLANLRRPLPWALLHQYLPDLFCDLQTGNRTIDPQAVLEQRIRRALQPYLAACRSENGAPFSAGV